MPINQKPPRLLKAVRIACAVLFVLCPLCWLTFNAATFAFFSNPNKTIFDAIIELAYRHLPVLALLCAIAASVLARKKQRTKRQTVVAGVLAIAAVAMIVPYLVLAIMIL